MIDKYLIITYSNINELNEIGLLSKWWRFVLNIYKTLELFM